MWGALVVATGCDDEKPYTPFQVATAIPDESDPTKQPSNQKPETEPAKKLTRSLRAPAGSTRWKAFERTLEAPAGTVFNVAIPDPNAESELVVAWVFSAGGDQGRSAAGLWSFGASGKPDRKILAIPEFLPRGGDCRPSADLNATGPRSITSHLRMACSDELLSGTPTHSLAVLTPDSDAPVVLHLSQVEPAPGEKLELSVDSSDRDEDGLDDILLTVKMSGPSGKSESLPFRWLSRTAGASRESGSPETELYKRSSRLLIASVRKAERGQAPAQVDTLRRLLSAVCQEWGTPILKRASGDALSCGSVSKALGNLVKVNVQSYLGEGQLSRALGAYEQREWFGKKVTVPTDLAGLLQPKIPEKPARKLARFRVQTKSSPQPYRSPLVFDDEGQLWAVTADKTKRLTMEGDPPLVIPATEEEPEKRIEPPAWSIEAKNSRGEFLQAAIPSCERSEVLLALGATNGKPGKTLPLSLLAPRPGECGGFAPTPLPAEPLLWEGSSLTVAVGGEVLSSGGKVRPLKQPVAWNTSLGLAVQSGNDLALWTGKVTQGLHHCTVRGDASRVACVDSSGVTVLTVDEEEAPTAAD